jgi:uncharacterized damage-inducible protein DinB
MAASTSAPAVVITPGQLQAHWQGHRRLTRRVIAAFPEDQLFTFSVGGMRPFGALAAEMLGMAVPTLRGILTGEWQQYAGSNASSREEVLRLWDETTAEIDALLPTVPVESFQTTMTAFGQWTMPMYELLAYVIDNEIHHRGQGYVYLRALGIEPPPFYERT